MKTALALAILTTALAPTAWSAESITARQIMEKQKSIHSLGAEVEHQSMLLVDKDGNKEKRQLARFSLRVGEDLYKYQMVFQDPTDIRGTTLLTWQRKDGADDQWLYLPALGQKLQRIAKGGGKGYFMGTDFTYEDLAPESLEENDYTLLREEDLSGSPCYVIETRPADEKLAKESGYSKKILWVRKDILLTMKIEFYNKRDKLVKTQTQLEVEKVQGEAYRAKKVVMDHHQNEHKTMIMVAKRELEPKLSEAIFTERAVLKGEALAR